MNHEKTKAEIVRALRELGQALRVAPPGARAEIHLLRGDWHSETGDYRAALADFEQVRRLAPRSHVGFRRCADTFRLAGNTAEAAPATRAGQQPNLYLATASLSRSA